MAAVIGGVLLYGGFGRELPGGPVTPRESSSLAPGAPASGVPWQDYESGLQSRIDAMAALEVCADLKRQLNAANAGNDATVARTGHDNAELVAYIRAAMLKAGCRAS